MKKYLIYLMMAAAVVMLGASCSPDEDYEPEVPGIETPETPNDGENETPDEPENPEEPGDNPDTPSGNSKILVAYFSWGGTTQRMAEEIVRQTGADIFRIEPVVPYPTEYTPCTEVAREEKDNNARPAIAGEVENWSDYDTVFIGCPVWWWTTPMIICTFAESYDFEGKTVVPFCTYASTYRDETLARIVELTPDAEHLTGEGLTSGRINEQNISSWLNEIGIIE
ncbi:flavodoxin [Paraprevotella xylaniphila]